MGYGDYTPSGSHHHKKPLSKEQLRKMQQAYKHADATISSVRESENKEQGQMVGELDTLINNLL